MSVINQMLLDLERRRAEVTNRGPIDFVRALPDGRDRRPFPWMLGVGALAGVLAIGALGLRVWPGLSSPREATGNDGIVSAPAAIPTAAVAPVAMNAPVPVVPTVESTLVPPAPATAPEAAPAAAAPATASPRLSLELAQLPERPSDAGTTTERSSARRAEKSGQKGASKAESRRDARAESVAAPTVAPAEGATVREIPRVAAAPAAASSPPARDDAELKQVSPEQQADNEFRRGSAALGLGRDGEARDAFARTLASSPSHDGARQALVGLFIHGKRNAEAERLLVERLAKDPGHAGFAMTAARLQMERGDLAAAIETLRRSQPAARGNADYAAFIAALYQRSGKHADAIEQYEAALRARPAAGVWWMGMGISLQAANRGAEAGEAFRRAKGTNTLNPELVAFVDERLRQIQ